MSVHNLQICTGICLKSIPVLEACTSTRSMFLQLAGLQGVSGDRTELQRPEPSSSLPLVSARLHKKWISDVQLVMRQGDSPLLLSASNDGTLAAWNLGQCMATNGKSSEWGRPLQLSEAALLHGGMALQLLVGSTVAQEALAQSLHKRKKRKTTFQCMPSG